MKTINGISPVLALVLTALVIALCIWMFATAHIFWGIVFALIAIDFAADAALSLKKV